MITIDDARRADLQNLQSTPFVSGAQLMTSIDPLTSQ